MIIEHFQYGTEPISGQTPVRLVATNVKKLVNNKSN